MKTADVCRLAGINHINVFKIIFAKAGLTLEGLERLKNFIVILKEFHEDISA